MSNSLGTKRLGTVLALVVAFAIALAMIVTPAAHAAAGNIDPNRQGTLTIHKHAAPSTGPHGDGTVQNPAPAGEKLAGVTFNVKKIDGINLTVAADWAKVQNLRFDGTTLSGVQGATIGADKGDQVTDSEGVATFANLPVGVYLVQETARPDTLPKAIDPFFVTIPFPHHPGAGDGATNNGWLYDVHVYPKNEVKGKLAKELDDSGDKLPTTKGSDLHWKLTVPVPSTSNAIVTFEVTDKLQHGTTLSQQNDVTATLDGAALVKDTDFVVTKSKTGTNPELVKITFKAAGLNKLNANYGKNIVIDLPATINLDLNDSGALRNKVVNNDFHRIYKVAQKPYDPNTPITGDPGEDPNYPPTPGDPTDDPYVPPTDGGGTPVPPTAFFGDFKLKKVATGTEIPLTGAKFQVYAANAAGDAIDETKAIGGEISSDASGIVKIRDLYLGKTDGLSKVYFVKETEAPAGYKLNATPIKITVTGTASWNATPATNVENAPYEKGDLPELPLTGASGKLLMTLGGAAIVLFAAGTVLVTRRRKA